MSEDKWSNQAKLHDGALARHGWREHESAEERHRALERSVRADGYKTTVERLVFMENVANREDNRGLHETAHADLEWIQRWERVDEGDEDRSRARGRQHRVEAYRKGDGTNVHSHLADNPRRR